jgi:choline transport protein
MIWSFVLNGLVGFIVLISFLFAIPSIEDALNLETNPSGFVFLYVFQQASYHGSIPLTVLIILVVLSGGIDSNCSTSRQVFAFARDGGMPFRSWLSKVQIPASLKSNLIVEQVERETVPQNAVIFTCVITMLLSLINLGSSVAFNAIISLQLLSLMSTYCISIGCVFYQRLKGGHSLPNAQWTLGRAGVWVNGIGFFYCLFILFWCGWPGAKEVTATNFNWSSVMFAGVFLFALGYYAVRGRKNYDGPVVLVRPL